MFYKLLLGFLSIGLFLTSCDIQIEAINYGADQCNFCKMNIVDKQHAAQYVTNKGKQFKFDAIECMINQIAEISEEDLAFMKVCDFSRPGEMLDAQEAAYLVSPGIKSPMGANLSAFSRKSVADAMQKEHEGAVFDWNGIKMNIHK